MKELKIGFEHFILNVETELKEVKSFLDSGKLCDAKVKEGLRQYHDFILPILTKHLNQMQAKPLLVPDGVEDDQFIEVYILLNLFLARERACQDFQNFVLTNKLPQFFLYQRGKVPSVDGEAS